MKEQDRLSDHAPGMRNRIIDAISKFFRQYEEGFANFSEDGQEVQLYGVYNLPSLANSIIDEAIAQQGTPVPTPTQKKKYGLAEIPGQHSFNVAVTIERVDAPGVELKMKVTIPSYALDKTSEVISKWLSGFSVTAVQNICRRLNGALESGDPLKALGKIDAVEVDIDYKTEVSED